MHALCLRNHGASARTQCYVWPDNNEVCGQTCSMLGQAQKHGNTNDAHLCSSCFCNLLQKLRGGHLARACFRRLQSRLGIPQGIAQRGPALCIAGQALSRGLQVQNAVHCTHQVGEQYGTPSHSATCAWPHMCCAVPASRKEVRKMRLSLQSCKYAASAAALSPVCRSVQSAHKNNWQSMHAPDLSAPQCNTCI